MTTSEHINAVSLAVAIVFFMGLTQLCILDAKAALKKGNKAAARVGAFIALLFLICSGVLGLILIHVTR